MRHDRENKPGISNLIEIYGVVTGTSIPAVEKEFEGQQYGAFKSVVADAVVEFLRPVQERYAALEADPAEVDRRLALGADAAETKAERGPRPRHEGRRPAPPPARLTLDSRIDRVRASRAVPATAASRATGSSRSAGQPCLPCTSP